LFLLLAITVIYAAPHRALPIDVTQPDGTPLRVYASGDEFHNWLHDSENYTIVRDDAGRYVYATQNGENVAPTDLLAGQDDPAQRGLHPGINLGRSLIQEKYDRYEQMRDYSNGRSPHTGQFNNLVIFIRFADDPPFSSPIGFYDAIFNDLGDNANSMRNYFKAASYDQLNVESSFFPAPDGTTIVCYIDTNPRNYYRVYSTANPIGYQGDSQRTQREQQMLARAVNFVSNQIPTSLDIDGDDDGYVDNVCFIIQGSPDGWAELLWPHRWVLYAASAYIHGSQVWDFNFQLETSVAGSGAGVLSHEMFHSLSAPDLYRYDDNTITPIGGWDIMASDTNPPQHMGAWMKYRYGQWFTEIPSITESGTYTLSPLASSATNNFYRIPSWRTNEYYLVEYRKPAGLYDSTLPGMGLLVYRLNTAESGNAQGPPDELYIYRPFGYNTTTNGALSMAAFSEQTGRVEISEATSPFGFMSNNSSGGLNLYDVGFAGDTISFKVKISDIQLTSPHGGETWFSGSNKAITWKAKSSTGTVTIEYSQNGGSSWTQIANTAPNNGSWTWYNVPVMNSPTMHIRLTLNSNGHTDSNVYPFAIVSELAIPQGIYPADNASGIPTNPMITWQNVPGATGYQFQVSANSEFNSFLVNEIGYPQSSYPVSGLVPFTTYYWRVASIADVGISPFCETMSFTTGDISELPAVPDLVSPAHMATNVPVDVTLSWTASSLASGYWLQVSTNPYFADPNISIQNITGTSYTASGLNHYTVYYWRVAAQNIAGSSNFSLARRFSTVHGTPNEDPVIPVPVNALGQNHPNPFNPSTWIRCSVKEPSKHLEVIIFNTRGQIVRVLHNAIPGKSELELFWDGKDDAGRAVSTGIYYYRMRSGDYSSTRKMLMLK
jgi:M6 family metalloprotease-like protein